MSVLAVDIALIPGAELLATAITLNRALGYDFNTVEFAVSDGVPYAIDFCNPAPDADLHSVGQAHFDWIVEQVAALAVAGAEKILKKQVDAKAHADLLAAIRREL